MIDELCRKKGKQGILFLACLTFPCSFVLESRISERSSKCIRVTKSFFFFAEFFGFLLYWLNKQKNARSVVQTARASTDPTTKGGQDVELTSSLCFCQKHKRKQEIFRCLPQLHNRLAARVSTLSWSEAFFINGKSSIHDFSFVETFEPSTTQKKFSD